MSAVPMPTAAGGGRIHKRGAATRARARNLLTLIKALGAGEMAVFDIACLFGCSVSGARKYIRELVSAGIVTRLPYEGSYGALRQGLTYQLTASSAETQAYLRWMAAQVAGCEASSAPPARAPAAQALPSVLHIMADDQHYTIRRRSQPPKRDPLVAALFGMGAA